MSEDYKTRDKLETILSINVSREHIILGSILRNLSSFDPAVVSDCVRIDLKYTNIIV